MLVVGLTGGIGAGKSTVAALLAAKGAVVIDVDALGRAVLEPGGAAERAVLARFGDAVAGSGGRIDRAALAGAVFGDPAALADLTGISHPAVNRLLEAQVDAARRSGAAVAVLDMAVLAESRLGYAGDGRRLYTVVVVVEASWEVRLARLVARGLRPEDASARRDAQASDAQRRALADFVIVNDGDLDGLAGEVDRLWYELLRRA